MSVPSAAASPSPLRPRHAAALLATTAVLGALTGFGLRAGGAAVLFGGAGLRLRGLPEFVAPDRGVDLGAVLGALHVAAIAYLWGALVALPTLAASRRRGPGALAARVALAAVPAALLAVADPWLPTPLRLGAGVLDLPQRAACAALVALAAVVGTGIAGRDRPTPTPFASDRGV